MKIKISISRNDVLFLIENLKNEKLLNIFILAHKNSTKYDMGLTSKIEISFNLIDLEVLADELSDLLIKKGLKETDEPNAFGLKIEELIDKFNPKKFNLSH